MKALKMQSLSKTCIFVLLTQKIKGINININGGNIHEKNK